MSSAASADEPVAGVRAVGRPGEPSAQPDEAATPRADEPGWDRPLPDAVRLRVVALASETLGALDEDEVAASLKVFRRWAPARRTKLAATPLATAVDSDVRFRQRVAGRLRERSPELAAALDRGERPSAADPVDVAAAAYVLRSPSWAARVAEADEHLDRAVALAETAQYAATVARLQDELAAAQSAGADRLAALEDQLATARAEAAAVARELREEKGARRRAERAAAEAEQRSASAVERAAQATASAEADVRRMEVRLRAAEDAVEAARRATREGRNLEDARVRLLLDTVLGAADGLRRELALPPRTERPADFVVAAEPGADVGPHQRALPPDDPALLDQLLALPQVHLVVDGYNVTKTGYPDLSLEQQRARLVTGLVALAAQSGAEVTCCFDGSTVAGRIPSMTGRGVRVLFSRPDEIADELIRRVVTAEPTGRPVVVVTSDRELAESVRRAGARPVGSPALVKRLGRG